MRIGRAISILLAAIIVGFIARSVYCPGARPMAIRVACASNLKQIGSAVLAYEREHATVPLSLSGLAAEFHDARILRADTLACRGSHLSYIYIPLVLHEHRDAAIAFDADLMHWGNCGNVLFGDGHVECVTKQRYSALIQQSINSLAQEIATRPAGQPAPDN